MARPTPPRTPDDKAPTPAPASKKAAPKPVTHAPTRTPTKAPAKLPAKVAAKVAVETAVAAKPASVEPAKPAPAGKPAKPAKLREELVRDSFTMPQSDFTLIAQLKERALATKRAAKKSELLRAGLQALAALDSKSLVAALDRLTPIKTGRPKKGH